MQQQGPVFGVIGAGFIGRIHLKALTALGLPVGAIAEPSAEARAAAAELVPSAVQYQDWRELLADPNITAVHICTINSMHYEILAAAVAAGKHVLCEKTMTTGAVQAREALALKLNKGQIVQIGYMKRFFPSSQWAKATFEAIGEPICATVRSFQGGLVGPGIYDSNDWRPANGEPSRTRRFASGGMLNMAGSHMLDMTGWLLGEPRSVMCHTWSPVGYDAELQAHALFRMANGMMVHFEAALPTYSKTGVYGNGWEEYIQIDGRHGRLEVYYPLWDKPADFSSRARVYLEEDNSWHEPEFPKVDAFQLEVKAFAEACRTGRSEAASIADGARVDFWIEACYRSAAMGREVAFASMKDEG